MIRGCPLGAPQGAPRAPRRVPFGRPTAHGAGHAADQGTGGLGRGGGGARVMDPPGLGGLAISESVTWLHRTGPPRAILWPQAQTPPSFVLVTHSARPGVASPPHPDVLSEGCGPPSDVAYSRVPNFWPRPRVSVPNVAPGFLDTTCCAGAGGVWADSGAAPCRSRTLRFLGRFGVDPLFRCAYRSSVKALTVQGQPPFHRGRAPLGTPRPGGHARGTRAAGWGGVACKGAAGYYRGHFGPAE